MKDKNSQTFSLSWNAWSYVIIFIAISICAAFLLDSQTLTPWPKSNVIIPFDFSLFGPTNNQDPLNLQRLSTEHLSVLYKDGLLVIENESSFPEPTMIYGHIWYYRVQDDESFTVSLISSATEKVTKFPDIMIATNNCGVSKINKDCNQGSSVKLLNTKLEEILVETGPHQYVVINP